MKYFASCEIIKDLLPNYTDNKLSSDSNLLVKEHIDGCYSCKNEYENMNRIIKLDTLNIDSLDYFKKLNKRFVILLISILAICVFSTIGTIFYTESSLDEAIFTLILLLFGFILLSIQYILPLAILIFSILHLKNSKNKLLILPIAFCILWLLFFIFSAINTYILYG